MFPRQHEFDIDHVVWRDDIGLSPLVEMKGARSRIGVLFLPPQDHEPRFCVFQASDPQRPGMNGFQSVAVWRGTRQEFRDFLKASGKTVEHITG